MQAIEFAQHGRCRRPGLCFLKTGNQDLDTGAENEGFLLMQRSLGAGRQERNKNGQKY